MLDNMDDKLTTIFTAATPVQARLLKNLLDEEGIPAYLVNEALQGAVGEVPFGWSTAVRVAVASDYADEARGIAKDFESRLIHERPIRDRSVGDDIATLWPACPSCRRPRTAVCPWCGTSGTHFPAADPEPADEQDRTDRWICSTCDEPFEDRFLRWCEWCNHDFGTGVQVAAPKTREADYDSNPRIMLVLLSLVGLVILLMIYFSIVLAR
jgi:hypothetical protein